MWLSVDHHLIEEQECPRLRRLRRIVRDPHDDGLHASLVLGLGQHALEGVVSQGQGAGRVGDVDPRQPDLREVSYLSDPSTCQKP